MSNGEYFMGMHLVWWIVWLIVLVGAVVILRRRKDSPREILQRRYTIGDISIDEYNMRKEHFSEMLPLD